MSELQRYLLIAVGGAIGSCARYWIGSAVASRYGTSFPWGTFVVNVTGSLVIGGFLALSMHSPFDPRWRFFVAIGLCGGYTTFSTFAYETSKLIEARDYTFALANAGGSAVASILAVFGGAILVRWLQ